MPFTGEQCRVLLHTARHAIRQVLSGHAPIELPELDGHVELREPAGCFVSLHELGTHRLRGCVGRLESRDALLISVHEAAVSVLRDPRFVEEPVTLIELARLEIELTVLSPMTCASHCLDFEPTLHGIHLLVGGRSGCFLPQVARETGWNREQLLDRLCIEKLGYAPHAWKHPSARLHTFTAEIVGPEPFEPMDPPSDA
jgi:AmmeMemoRadiSam system protein A